VKISKSSKQLLRKLEEIKENLYYFAGNSAHWENLNSNFKDLEDYLVENSISTKLHNARFKKKLDMVNKLAEKKEEV